MVSKTLKMELIKYEKLDFNKFALVVIRIIVVFVGFCVVVRLSQLSLQKILDLNNKIKLKYFYLD